MGQTGGGRCGAERGQHNKLKFMHNTPAASFQPASLPACLAQGEGQQGATHGGMVTFNYAARRDLRFYVYSLTAIGQLD